MPLRLSLIANPCPAFDGVRTYRDGICTPDPGHPCYLAMLERIALLFSLSLFNDFAKEIISDLYCGLAKRSGSVHGWDWRSRAVF